MESDHKKADTGNLPVVSAEIHNVKIQSVNSLSQVLHCNVAIVGAGIAGLAAAVTLVEAGCTDILLLEAQDKPGGRIQTVRFADGFIDLGAQWLHGDKNNLWKMSHDCDLISSRTVYEGRGVFLREDGYQFDHFLIEKVNFIVGHILENCEEFVDSIDVPDSVGKYLEEKFRKYLKENSMSSEEIRLYLELYDWNLRFQVIDNCCDSLYNVSAKFWGRYFCPTSGGQAHINYSKGHSSVVDVLVGKLQKNTLLTNNPILNVNWSMNDNIVKLMCQNTSVIEADAVIVTSSLGVLKQRASKLFSPSLPLEMTETISAMGFASIGKIFLLFEEKWWADEEGFQLIWNFDHPYDDDWCRYLSGFDPVLDQPCMLLGWIGGKGAEVIEFISEEEIGRTCAVLLRKFTGNKNITNPVQVVRSTWSTNPWILGGYSHTTPKCDNQMLLPEILQKPLKDQQNIVRVLLAGEHTHAEHFSTTHGAYESGMRQAQVLIDEERYKLTPRRISACGSQSAYKILIYNRPDDYFIAETPGYGIKILFHDSYNYPGWSAPTELVGMTEETFISITPEVIYATDDLKSMKTSERNCLFDWERSLKYFRTYSHTNCLTECRINLFRFKCGCVPLFYWHLDAKEFNQSNVHACDIKTASCVDSLTSTFSNFFPGFKYYGSRKFDYNSAQKQSLCKCLPSCEENIYRIEASKTVFSRKHAVNKLQFFQGMQGDNYSYINIFFKDLVSIRYRKDINMNWYSELAWFGGLLGLCLGFSFTSGFEMLYYITIRFCINYFHRKKLLVSKNNMQNIDQRMNNRYQAKNKFQMFPVYNIEGHYLQNVPPLNELYKLKKTHNNWYID